MKRAIYIILFSIAGANGVIGEETNAVTNLTQVAGSSPQTNATESVRAGGTLALSIRCSSRQ